SASTPPGVAESARRRSVREIAIQKERRTSNVQLPTSNDAISTLDVERWTFDVLVFSARRASYAFFKAHDKRQETRARHRRRRHENDVDFHRDRRRQAACDRRRNAARGEPATHRRRP